MGRKTRLDLRQPGDGPRMRAVIDWCEKSDLPVERCTQHQLRIGPWNIWPETGSYNFNGEPSSGERGFASFKAAFSAWFARERAEYGESLGE